MDGVRHEESSPASPGRALAVATGLGVGGYVFASLLVAVAVFVLVAVGVPILDEPTLLLGISTVLGQGVAFGAFAFAYLSYTDRGLDYVKARVPTLRDVGWTVGGTIALFGGLVTLSLLFMALGIESASNTVEQFGEQDPTVFLLLIPLSFLFIGPGEELLYRGVVQGRLREAFGPWVAIIAASFLFAVIHVFSLTGGGKIVYLAILFVLSPVLGAAYEWTDNLVVPSLIHGAFNAVQFYVAYLGATGGVQTGML
ncbi:CPBP family intramembrane glutamic endopeptidase [Halorussus litoreus]|uniref:CPBP family intramembrane glutamic endopeptidase n=1 Tax=Halorussus litoreus TaxID=1710536 RepID=UPI000E27E51E|nr:CPBP family intramembrane glutamic endopeptidase [Halorussus litoreus]